ncbi:type IV pilus assembly protein FimV [Psychrobacter aestuarii]|uniref:FimV N-terminal domain-containing protein n=1 Tax=Psychrobacter aestuarii TaxID=556327 RepID=A0ABN0VN38_9GAMM|nr:hypothetical protein [Psychrobacter aestuarii]
MSWSVAHPYRLNSVSYAVFIALCTYGATASLSSQAANFGSLQIHSTQNEPLSASIGVSDVDVAHFSAYLASDVLYQEMGLTHNPTISARFVADSVDYGRIVLTSTQPITMPFADVVLTVNNNGDRDIIPKTLLMPLVRPALMHTPLMVQNSAPPPLSAAPITSHTPVHTPLMAQQVTAIQPLAVIATDVMPPLPSAAKTRMPDAPLLAQQALTQTPLLVKTITHMPPLPSAQPSAPISTNANAPLLAQQNVHQAQTERSAITVQQPVDLAQALDTVLVRQTTAQPLAAQQVTELPALPRSQPTATVIEAPLQAATALPSAATTNIQTTRRMLRRAQPDTPAEQLQTAAKPKLTPVHIQTTRRIQRTVLPERPQFLDDTRANNNIALNSSHDMLDDAMLSDLTGSSHTVVRTQTIASLPTAAYQRAELPIKNQKAIELAAHLQELSN